MSRSNEQKWPIPESVNETENYMKQRVGLGISFDLGVRKLKVLKKDVHIYFCNGLCDTRFIIELIEELVQLNDHEKQSSEIYQLIYNRLLNQSVQPIHKLDELVDLVLSGQIVVVIEGEKTALAVDVRSYPGRSPQEPIPRRLSEVPVMALLKISS